MEEYSFIAYQTVLMSLLKRDNPQKYPHPNYSQD